jgi:hypothetical protein
MPVINYKTSEIDSTKLNINAPVKNQETSEYECSLTYEGEGLLFSSPRIRKQGDSLVFNIIHKKKFLDFIDHVEQQIVCWLFENSTKLFKGKKFSLERLKDSLQPSIDISETGIVTLNTEISPNVICFDLFGSLTDLNEVGQNVTSVILVDKIVFDKDLFMINYVVTHLKATKPEKNLGFSFEIPKKVEERTEIIEEHPGDGNFFD